MHIKSLADQIINLKRADLKLRDELLKRGVLSDGYHPEMEALHLANAEKLGRLIDEMGYPTPDKVGQEASEAAWLVIQHAISQPAFMLKCAMLLKDAVTQNEELAIPLAYLQDRIATLAGQPQLYGTQYDWDANGQMSPQLLEDLDKVNKRRQSLGLNSVEEQTQIMRERVKQENESPPQDYELRQQTMLDWKRKVGWLKKSS